MDDDLLNLYNRGLNFLKLKYGIKMKSNFHMVFVKKGLIVVDKSTNKVQFRQMEKSIQIILTIGISFGSRPIADYFHDQTICIADCENLTIGHSLFGSTS